MSMEVSLSPNTNSRVKKNTASLLWIYLWVVASALPIIPYASPLWAATLADTPYAYLIWIPVFAFAWAGWTLRRAQFYTDDAELNGLVSIPLLILSGALLVSGVYHWQYYFIGQSAGLLVWPFWSLGMAWLMFGVGVTRYVIRPLSYLLLAWPPLYSSIVNVTNPVLENLANRSIIALDPLFTWVRIAGSVGAYNVFYGAHYITVYVTSVCSGADSLLAMTILLPIIMVSFVGSFMKKAVTILLAGILALLANLVRLWIIIASIHIFGPNFSLGILHPVLGIILFIGMVALIIRFSHMIGMENRKFQRSVYLKSPGSVRFGLSVLSFGALTFLLFPLYMGAPGTSQSPIAIKSNVLTHLMPKLLGWQRSLIGNYNESSILGPNSKSTAMTYQTFQGDYALAELWWTYQPISLQGYTENNCLLFHGAQIISANTINVANGIPATEYTVLLPPKTLGGSRSVYIDTVYSLTVKQAGRTAYLRSEIATPVMLNVPSGSPIISQIHSAVVNLLNPTYPDQQGVGPLSADESVHVHNYMVFVHQYTGSLIRGRELPITHSSHKAPIKSTANNHSLYHYSNLSYIHPVKLFGGINL